MILTKNKNHKFKLKEKYGDWALITGGSSGIGKGFAELLTKEGVNCILVSNNETELKETLLLLKKISNETIIITKCIDLTNDSELDSLLKIPEISNVKILVNSAGVGLIGYLIQFTLERSIEIDRLNSGTVLRLSYFFAKKFYERKEKGAIINISSANADVGLAIPFSSVYSSGKSWVKFFTQSLYFEMKPFGVDVINVGPGPTKTNFQSHAQTKTLSWAESPYSVAEKTFKNLGKRNSITTNPVARGLLFILRILPFTEKIKLSMVAWFYGRILARNGLVSLPERESFF